MAGRDSYPEIGGIRIWQSFNAFHMQDLLRDFV